MGDLAVIRELARVLRGARRPGRATSVDVAPSHLFGASEAHLLRQFLQLVLENAWDAQCVAIRNGRAVACIDVSHDEWAEVRRQ